MNWIKAGVALVTGTAGAILYFAPMDMVKANTEQIVMLQQTDQLSVWEDRRFELEEKCLDKGTDEWICSQRQRSRYEQAVRQIRLLEKELGLTPEEPEGGP